MICWPRVMTSTGVPCSSRSAMRSGLGGVRDRGRGLRWCWCCVLALRGGSWLLRAVAAPAGAPQAVAAPASCRWSRRRTSGAASPRSSAASKVSGDEHHRQPDTDPHSYEPTAAGRAHDGRRAAGDRQRHRLRRMGVAAAGRQPGRRARGAGRGRSARAASGRQPAPVVLAGAACTRSSRRSRPTTTRSTRRTPATSPSAAAAFETTSLARYDRADRAEIRARYAGVPVGYSESIFQPLGEDLGLKLLTPYSFVKAIAEGTEVSAQDKQTVDRQAQNREIKVWVFNSQNVDARRAARERDRARRSTSRSPRSPRRSRRRATASSSGRWRSCEGLARALHEATGTMSGGTDDAMPRCERGRPARTPAIGCVDARRRIGGRTSLERRRSAGASRASSSRCSDPTAPASRRC